MYALAERLGCSFAQLAIAWSLKNESVQCLLLGASNIDQLYESLQSLQVPLDPFPIIDSSFIPDRIFVRREIKLGIPIAALPRVSAYPKVEREHNERDREDS